MRGLVAAIGTESLKIRKSKIFLFTLLAFAFIPAMLGVFVLIARDPGLARQLGLIGTKASMFGDANWPSFFELLNEMLAALGLLGFGFVFSWVFGREYAEHTLKDLLALPVSRAVIVSAKFFVALIWCLLLACELFLFILAIGGMVQLAGWTNALAFANTGKYVVIALLTIWLSAPVAFFASYGRGYLAPLGFVIIVLILANLIATVGLGPYFPWAIPGIYSIAVPTANIQLGYASFIILALTGLAGVSVTFAWWTLADQT